jgi:hypothetical protein
MQQNAVNTPNLLPYIYPYLIVNIREKSLLTEVVQIDRAN